MKIEEIASQETISGTLQSEDSSGTRQTVVANATVTKDNFKVVFFDELPLSLE